MAWLASYGRRGEEPRISVSAPCSFLPQCRSLAASSDVLKIRPPMPFVETDADRLVETLVPCSGRSADERSAENPCHRHDAGGTVLLDRLLRRRSAGTDCLSEARDRTVVR